MDDARRSRTRRALKPRQAGGASVEYEGWPLSLASRSRRSRTPSCGGVRDPNGRYSTTNGGDHVASRRERRYTIGPFVRATVRKGNPDWRRRCGSVGCVAIHRAVLAHQRRRTTVHENGARCTLPASGRRRIRTAGSCRDASVIRSHADAISCLRWTPLARLAT